MKQRIGEEVTEQLEYVPAKLSVIAHVRPKYACNRLIFPFNATRIWANVYG